MAAEIAGAVNALPIGAALRVDVPATTSNFGPGFDALGMALTLCNRFEVVVVDGARGSVSIEVTGFGADLSRGADNLVLSALRSAVVALQHDPDQLPALRLRLDNHVPLGSGLGSSSTAICGGLALGRALLGLPDDRRWLLDQACALEGHPDNAAPCVLGGLVTAVVDGGVLALPLPLPEALCCVAVTPALTLSTAAMRAALPADVPFADAVHNCIRATLLGAALAMGRLDLLALATADRLHEHVRGAFIPGFEAVRRAGLAAGARAVILSGAGPTLLALLDDDAHAGAIADGTVAAFAKTGVDATARVLRPRKSGLEVVRLAQ